MDDSSVAEGDGATTITVTATVDGTIRFAGATTVTVSVAGSGTASAVDFAAVTDFDITIAAGAASQTGTFTLTPTVDTADETDETITVSGASPGLTVNSATITLTDDDGEPRLSINSPSVTEGNSGSTNLTFTVTLSPASAQQVTVAYADAVDDTNVTNGTATSGTDYTALTAGTLTFAAGTTSQTFNVAVTGDTLDEANETVVVPLSNPTNAAISDTAGTGTGTITDDDATPTLSINSPSVTEGNSGTATLTFTVTLSAASGRQVTVAYADAGTGTATSGTDYTAITGGTLTFPAGTTSQTFDVSVTGDTTDEANETVAVTLSGATNATIATGTGTGTITDDDGPTVSIDSPSVTEGNSGATTLTFTATLSAASAQQVTVDYADAGTGTATSGTDYTAITAGALTFAVGTTSQTFTVAVTVDTTDETNETVVVTLSNPTNATIATATGTGTITDDDGPTISIDSPSVTEGDSGSTNLTFTVTLSAASAQPVTVTWADAGTGTATSGTDYTAITGGTLTFAAGTTSQTFNVAVTGDTTDETNETIVVTLSSPTNATIATATGTGTITSDDGPTVSIDSPTVTEGDSGTTNMTFTATLSAASVRQVTVAYADATTGTATSGTDYTAITAGTLTFAAGTTSQTFNVAVTGDATDEADETVVVSLSNPTNATIATATGTGTITDDDGPTVSIDSPSVAEGDSGSTNLTFTATLSAASVQPVTVAYADAGTGTATSGTDYTAITGGTLTFAAGTTSQTFNVAVTGDTTDEADETVVVTLSSPTNATISTANGTGTITNDDAPTLSIDSPSVTEGDSGSTNLTFTVTLSAASVRQVTVAWAEGTGGTATSGTDYTTITGGTLTFAAGTTSQTFSVAVTGDTTDETNETVVVTLSSPTNATIATGTGTGTITDDDGPTLSIDSPSVAEGNSGSTNLTFTATLSAASVQPVTVAYADAGTGTATSGTDYTTITGATLTFPAGTTSQTFNVSVLGDATDEANETVVAALSSPTNATISTATGTGTITDDDGPALSIDSPSVTEGNSGSTNLTFTVTLSAASAQQVTVGYADATTGTATSGTDYTAITAGTLTFAVGATSQTFNVAVTGDATDEADETVVVTLSSPTNATISTATGTGTITDDDGPTVSINSPSVAEGDSGSTDLTFTVTLSAASVQQVTVAYADATTGTATSGTDYTAITGATLTFAVGATSQTFNVSVLGDALDEANETVLVSLSGATNATVSATTGTGTGTITDDDGEPTLSINSPSVTEGDSGSTDLTFTVTLSAASGQQVTVAWAEGTGGTATSGTDYTAITGAMLTFAAGTTSQTFTVAVLGDVLDESDETVVVTLSSPANATISSTAAGTGTGTITDDDAEPSITLTVDESSVGEGDGATLITVTATVDGTTRFAAATTVTVSVAGSGEATAVDFTAVADFDITIAAGAASQTGTFTLTPTVDTADETDETITVSGASGDLTVNSATISLTDDDGAPSLSINSPSVSEGNSGSTDLTFTVTLSPASAQQVTVAWAEGTGGTATSGTDYTAITGATLTFAAGTTSQTFNVAVTGDALDEANETVVLTLSNPTNATISSTAGTGTGTITDDDATPTLSINSPSVAEGDSGSTNLTFTATLSAASGRQVTVDYADDGSGSATSGTDYTAITAGTLTFPAGTTSQTFNVAVTGDATDELNETIVVTLSGATNVTVPTANSTGTITDDDGPTLSVDSPSVAEGDSGSTNLTFTATLSAASVQQVTVDWGAGTGGTATSGTDYTAITGGTLTFPAGTTSQTFNVAVTGDTTDEVDETVAVTLSDPTNATIATGTGTGTITDDDGPAVSINSPSVTEGDSGSTNLTFTVTLSAASVQQVTVDYADAGTGTATSGTDYTAITGGTLTFPVGTTSQTFNVAVTGDATDEADETVVVTLSSPTNATISTANGTGTITTDDGPTVSIDSPSVTEGDSGSTNLTFTVSLSAASVRQVTVAYADAGTGTATSGTDYTAITDATLTFPAGTTSQTFNVAVTGDTTDEANETIVVTLSSSTNATIAAGAGTGTITDDDGPAVSIDSPSVAEGDSGSTNLTFTVSLSAASAQQVTVAYADAGTGTATSGTDYTAITGGTLTFPVGTTSQTFNVAVTGDATNEANETVVVTLSSPTNATISTANGTGTITNDDGSTLSIDSPTVAEGDSGSTNLTFTVTLSATSAQQVTVDYADAGTGTATSGTDYTAITAGTLTFAAGATSQTFTVAVTGDATDEANETVVVTLSSPTNATIAAGAGTGTITDDDGPAVSIDSPTVREGNSGSTNLTFTVTLSAASAQQVTVAWAEGTGGTATSGTDYTAITGGTLTFPVGTTSQTFTVAVTGDATVEVDETVVVTLSSPTNATISTATGTGTITNDDVAPGARWTPGGVWTHDVTTTSAIGKLTLRQTVTITGGSMLWANAAIDACPWTRVTPPLPSTSCQLLKDYSASGFPDRQDLRLTNFIPTQAMIDNGGVVIRLRWRNFNSPAGNNVGMVEWVPLITPPSATLVLTPPSISENGGVATVSATLDRQWSDAVTITVSAAAVAPAVAGDFTRSGMTLTFAANTTTSTGTVTLTAVDNAIDAADKAVTVSGTASDSVTNAPPDVTLTITDDETPTLSIDSPTVAEGDSGSVDMTFTVSLSPASAQQVTVDWADAGTGTATSGTDYTAITGGTLTFPAGTTSQTITVSVTGDTAAEPNETVAVSLSNPANATIGTGTGTGTITDDDGAAPTLSIDSPRVAEGDGGSTDLTFTVTLSPASAQQVTVDWADAGTGTATSGTDYTAITGGTLTFPAGTTAQRITVSVTGDTAAEPNETVAVSLSNPANATIGTGTGTGTITDDDGGIDDGDIGAPSLSIDSPRVAEGDSGATDLTFTVTLSPASAQQVKVDWADAGTGTATSGTDYAAIAGGTLTFAAGETSKSFTVSVTGDVLDEADETVVASLSKAGNATVSTATGTGTIVDDDAAPSLSIDSPSVAEGDGGATDMTFTVTLSAASGKQVTVDWADAGSGTATPGTDYAAVAGGTLAFAAGETSKSFTASVTGDVLDEADETVVAALSSPTNATISTTTGTGTITDDDAAPTLSIDSPSVAEGDGGSADLTFTATLSAASGRRVTVDYADAGTGTAMSGTDYAAIAGGTLAFAAGETSKSFTVSVTGDVLAEADETVVAVLSRPANAVLGTARGVGTIIDDDVDLTPSFGGAAVPDQSWIQNWPIPALTLPAATGGNGALTYALAPALPAGLSFDAATRELSGTPTRAQAATEYSLMATDGDGDVAALSFTIEVTGPVVASIADAQAVEGEPAEFGVTLSKPVPEGGSLLVVWRTADGTAVAPSDYAPPAGGRGELTIAAGQDAAAIAVQTVDDGAAEGEEAFTVRLVSAGHAELGDAAAAGRIVDDDLARLRGEALQWSLAAFGRTVATEAVDAIGQRFRPGAAAPAATAPWAGELDALGAPPRVGGGAGWRPGGGAAGAFGAPGAGRGLPPGDSAAAGLPGGAAGAERSPLGELLSQAAFESRLGAKGEDAGDGGRWTLWGRGSRSRFSSGSGAGLSLDGEVDTGYLGADARLSEGGPLLGVALSHSVGELGYRGSASGLEGGRVDVDLSSALPYGHWSVGERASLWALLGIGWGKAVLTDRFGRSESDTSMRMAALGGRGELAPWRGLALALKGDAFAVGMEGSPTLGGAAAMPDVDADARRLRVMVEGRRGWQPSARQSLELSLEFGGRWDGGDADAGMGAELGGGLAYRHAAWGLGVEARGRRLLGHAESAFEEWGASVSVALDPGEEGVGASLSLSPVWGEASSGVENMWRSERLLGAGLGGQAERAGRGGWRPGRLRMELGYGFETRGPSLLRLYGGLEEDGPGSRSWRLGGGMTGGRLDWSLELDRRERWGEPPEHGVLLKFGNGFMGAAPAAPPL